MEPIASALTLSLARAQFLRLRQPAGLCLQVNHGTLWITVDGRPDDLELAAGERLCFDAGTAPVVIGTLGGAAEFRAERRAAGVPQLAWA